MDKSRKEKLSDLAANIPYSFKKLGLFDKSLSHTSFVNENSGPRKQSYERLEFLGDAVLSLSIGHILMEKDEMYSEGELSQIRASLVNEKVLAKISRKIGLADALLLGKGERRSGGKRKRSILADLYESMIGAIYLDGGFNSAFKVIKLHFHDLIDSVTTTVWDSKSRLQELSQGRFHSVPSYKVTSISGPDHKRVFTVELKINSEIIGEGTGGSKKEAEQAAAHVALKKLIS